MAYPRIAKAFALYLDCRTQQLFHMEIQKDKGKRAEHKVVVYTTGYHSLPVAGGMLDQPYWLMEIFSQFKNGENKSAYTIINK